MATNGQTIDVRLSASSTPTQAVRIELSGHGRGRVWIDGIELIVVGLELEVTAGGVNILCLELPAENVSVEGACAVVTAKADV